MLSREIHLPLTVSSGEEGRPQAVDAHRTSRQPHHEAFDVVREGIAGEWLAIGFLKVVKMCSFKSVQLMRFNADLTKSQLHFCHTATAILINQMCASEYPKRRVVELRHKDVNM